MDCWNCCWENCCFRCWSLRMDHRRPRRCCPLAPFPPPGHIGRRRTRFPVGNFHLQVKGEFGNVVIGIGNGNIAIVHMRPMHSGLNDERSRLRLVTAASVLSARADVQPFFSIHGQVSQIVGAHGHLAFGRFIRPQLPDFKIPVPASFKSVRWRLFVDRGGSSAIGIAHARQGIDIVIKGLFFHGLNRISY